MTTTANQSAASTLMVHNGTSNLIAPPKVIQTTLL